jgi:hypothetical protein
MPTSLQNMALLPVSDQLLAALLNLAGGRNSERYAHAHMSVLRWPGHHRFPTHN